MDLRAGSVPPAPDELAPLERVHAVDGDGTPVCESVPAVEPVDDVLWSAVPAGQRCSICQAVLGR